MRKKCPHNGPTESLVIGQENGNAKRTRMAATDVEELESDHEEADSRMFIHTHYAAESENAGSAIFTSPDTDAAVLLFVSLFHAEFHRAVVSYWHWGKEKVHSDARHSGKTFRRNNSSVVCISHSDGL